MKKISLLIGALVLVIALVGGISWLHGQGIGIGELWKSRPSVIVRRSSEAPLIFEYSDPSAATFVETANMSVVSSAPYSTDVRALARNLYEDTHEKNNFEVLFPDVKTATVQSETLRYDRLLLSLAHAYDEKPYVVVYYGVREYTGSRVVTDTSLLNEIIVTFPLTVY